MRRSVLLLAALLAGCASTPAARGASSPAVAPSPSPSPIPATGPSAPTTAQPYVVGSGDVIDVNIFGSPELSRSATVQNDGTVSLPLLGEVRVAGLTIEQIEKILTEELGEKYLVNPQIDVQVREYNSQFVSVLGEVNQPGRRALKGGTRLIDVLLDAGGLRATASGEISVSRPAGFGPGAPLRRTRISPSGVGPAEQAVLEMLLQAGDIVTALPKQFLTVQGEVVRPGRYPLDADLTITGVISLAGGLTRFGSNKVDVLRVEPGGNRRKLGADLKEIREGKEPDLVLQPNDIITVPRRFF